MLLTKHLSLIGFTIVIVSSIACSIMTIVVYDVFFSQKTVLMDIAGFITSQKEDYASGKISAGELVENIDALVSQMNAAKRNQVFILDTVTAGDAKHKSAIADYTAEDDEDREK